MYTSKHMSADMRSQGSSYPGQVAGAADAGKHWLAPLISLQASTRSRTHARTHARTHSRTHARMHTCIGTYMGTHMVRTHRPTAPHPNRIPLCRIPPHPIERMHICACTNARASMHARTSNNKDSAQSSHICRCARAHMHGCARWQGWLGSIRC